MKYYGKVERRHAPPSVPLGIRALIPSKGHLSTYYKFKVKASSDDLSRQPFVLGMFTVLLPPLASIVRSCPGLTQIQGATELRHAPRRAIRDILTSKVIFPCTTSLRLKCRVMSSSRQHCVIGDADGMSPRLLECKRCHLLTKRSRCG